MVIRRALARYVLPVLLLGTPWFSSCRDGCCVAEEPLLLVESSPDGGVVPNVDAFVVGVAEQNGQLECAPTSTATACYWPGAPDPGSFTIRVAAPGYLTVNVAVTLSYPARGAGVLSPSVVVLVPGDGGP